MNDIKRAISNFFSGSHPELKADDFHDLDSEPPVVRSKQAGSSSRLMQSTPSTAAGNANGPQPESSERKTTLPTYSVPSPRADAETVFNAIKNDDINLLKRCIAEHVDMNIVEPSSRQSALQIALTGKQFAMVKALLPVTSRANKLEALSSMLNLKLVQRKGLQSGIDAIVVSLNKGNDGDAPLSAEEKSDNKLIFNLLNKFH